MAEDKEFQHLPIKNILEQLQQALDCSDLSTKTDLIIKYIQSKNLSKDTSEEEEVIMTTYIILIIILYVSVLL
jgi:hypothetical protein